jgi:beta-glucuronidase
LYCTPKTYIEDVTVVTNWAKDKGTDTGTGTVDFKIEINGDTSSNKATRTTTRVSLRDALGQEVGSADSLSGRITVPHATPWQPGKAYLYTLEVAHGDDRYSLAVGLRSMAPRSISPALANTKTAPCAARPMTMR